MPPRPFPFYKVVVVLCNQNTMLEPTTARHSALTCRGRPRQLVVNSYCLQPGAPTLMRSIHAVQLSHKVDVADTRVDIAGVPS